jgi:hypothetical protein
MGGRCCVCGAATSFFVAFARWSFPRDPSPLPLFSCTLQTTLALVATDLFVMSLLKQINDKGAVVEWCPISNHGNLVALGTKVGISCFPLPFHSLMYFP